MTVFIAGGAKCGKSSIAQELAVKLAGGGKLYYVATMIPTGAEDDDRIRRHLLDRAGMGFETIECFRDLGDIRDRDATFLVDNITSLMQNALFPAEKNYEMDLRGAESCTDSILQFAATARHAVFVSDQIYCDAETYSETTEQYRKRLADTDRALANLCDVVLEVMAGCPIIYKGGDFLENLS